jgi:hypothetical protein
MIETRPSVGTEPDPGDLHGGRLLAPCDSGIEIVPGLDIKSFFFASEPPLLSANGKLDAKPHLQE